MRKHYDFSEARPNPYVKQLKKQVTIRLEEATLTYFKQLAAETAIPYQTLINMYLRDCATHRKQLRLEWVDELKAMAGTLPDMVDVRARDRHRARR